MNLWDVIRECIILMGFAVLLGSLFERMRQSAIVGYLLAGCLVGPGALNLVTNQDLIGGMAEIGVSLLLFAIGLEFSLARLVSMGRSAIGGGGIQIVATTLVFAVIGRVSGLGWSAAVALGLLAAPSSTACVLRMLRERSELDSIHGRNALGILLLQDLAIVPLVVLISALSEGTSVGALAAEIAVAVVFFVLLVAGFYVTTVHVLPRAYWAVSLLRNREILILMATVLALGAMWAAHSLGVSPALGAFVAGMLLAESPFATQVRTDVGTIRVIFVTLFFAAVGMVADIPWIMQNWPLVAGAIALVVIIKGVLIWAVMLGLRQPMAQSIATGICLAQIGEFSFMLAQIGRGVGVIDEHLFHMAVSVSVATMFLTPFLVSIAPAAGKRIADFISRPGRGGERDSWPAVPESAFEDHVLVIGFGPAGQSVAATLREMDIPVVIVELNPETVSQARQDGMLAELGDATHEEVLQHLRVTRARAVVVTLPDHRSALDVVCAVQAIAPEVPLIARSRHHRYASDFTSAGATLVVDEEIQIGVFLGERLAHGLSRRTP